MNKKLIRLFTNKQLKQDLFALTAFLLFIGSLLMIFLIAGSYQDDYITIGQAVKRELVSVSILIISAVMINECERRNWLDS